MTTGSPHSDRRSWQYGFFVGTGVGVVIGALLMLLVGWVS